MTSRLVEVEVFNSETPYSSGWMPEKLIDAIDWLQKKLLQVPKEHRSCAEIDIDTEDFDSSYAKIRISYKRPETAAEKKATLLDETKKADEERTVELKTLRRLQEKYAGAK